MKTAHRMFNLNLSVLELMAHMNIYHFHLDQGILSRDPLAWPSLIQMKMNKKAKLLDDVTFT